MSGGNYNKATWTIHGLENKNNWRARIPIKLNENYASLKNKLIII